LNIVPVQKLKEHQTGLIRNPIMRENTPTGHAFVMQLKPEAPSKFLGGAYGKKEPLALCRFKMELPVEACMRFIDRLLELMIILK